MDGKLSVHFFGILYRHYLSNWNLCTNVCFCMRNVASEQLSMLSMLRFPWCFVESDDLLWRIFYILSCITCHSINNWFNFLLNYDIVKFSNLFTVKCQPSTLLMGILLLMFGTKVLLDYTTYLIYGRINTLLVQA